MTIRLAPAEAGWFSLRTQAPLSAKVALEGPVGDLHLRARANLESSRVVVQGRFDVPARRGRAEVVAQNLRPERLVAGAPPIVVSAVLTLDGRLVQRAIAADVRLARGRLTVGQRIFDELDGAGVVRVARHPTRDSEATIHQLTGRFISHRRQPKIAARGTLRWTRERLALLDATLSFADSRWTGSATYLRPQRRKGLRNGVAGKPHVSVRVDTMTLSPDLIAEALRYRPRAAWTGRAKLDGTTEDLALQLETKTELGPAAVTARLQRGKGIHLTVADLHLGDSRMRGTAHLERGRLTASVDELVLAQTLVHGLLPALDPVWPIRLQVVADRPLDAFDLKIGLHAGPSVAKLHGRLALKARRFQVVGHVDRFDLLVLKQTKTRVQGTLELAGEGRLAGGGVIGTLNIRKARGFMMTSPFYRGRVDARFDGQNFEVTEARVEVPGAKIAGTGGGQYGKGFRIGYGVVITDAFALRNVPSPLRVIIGINGILPGRSVEGAITKRPGKEIEVTHRVLPIGISQLVFLFRILTGKLPSFHDF
jgi:hypothetical protein